MYSSANRFSRKLKNENALQFSIFNFQNDENWNSTSNFNFQSLRETKIFNFHKKWKLKFGCQFSYFNFSIPTSVLVSYFWYMKVRESLDRTITGRQRTTKTNSFGAKFQNGGVKQYSGPRICSLSSRWQEFKLFRNPRRN